MKNIYKEINYFGALIKVSKSGDIIWNGEKRNIYYNKDGYSVCSIKLPNIGWRSVRVARLVAIAYIPNPNNLPEVNHKDFDRKNSDVSNLEWISRKDNVNYSKCNMPNYNGKNNPNYGNKKLSERYKNDKDYAKEKQGRPGLKNGRCRKITIFKDGKQLKKFDYIADCCEYMCKEYGLKNNNSARSIIDKSVKNNKSYKGLMFIKE